jgi:hypothetical protein
MIFADNHFDGPMGGDTTRRARTRRFAIVLLALVVGAGPLSADKPGTGKHAKDAAGLRAVIWRDPGRMASLNLLYGAGGKGHAPDPRGTFRFLKEDPLATSPKFDVVDRQGVEWKVKLGEEPRSETSAARFMWAAGYFVDEDYYLTTLTVSGAPKLRRGEEFVSRDGTVHGARLERKLKDVQKRGTWDWFDNPFTDQRELNGLRVMMALLNNWDLKDVNNSVYETGGQRRYLVSDLGASFGNTGNSLTRSKSEPQEYADSKFVEHSASGSVDFVMHSRPFFLGALDIPNYEMRTRIEAITKKIPRADAKWLGQRLALLSDRQIADGFRAGGYAPADVIVYTQALLKRIAALNTL